MESKTLSDGLRETWAVFDTDGTPLTTPEVAEALDLGRRTAYARLERLVEHDRLDTKKVGASARVWWRPAATGSESGAPSVDDRREFESLVDAVDEYGIFTVDPDGYVRTWNAGARRIKGYEADEILGEHFSVFYTEADRADGIPEQNLATARAEGRVETEGWRRRADGSRFWADVALTPIRGDSGDIEAYAKVTRDMSEEKYATAERELLYETTRSIAEAETFEAGVRAALEDVCGVTDWEYAEAWMPTDDGDIRRIEADYHLDEFDAFAEFSEGYTVAPGEGLPGRVYESGSYEWASELPSGDEDAYPRLQQALDANLVSSLGVPVVADGETVAVLSFLMRDARESDERLVRLVSSVAAELGELLAHRRTEEELKRQREVLTQVFETAPVGIGIFGADRELRRANERGLDVLGLEPDSQGEYRAGELDIRDEDGEPVPFEELPVGHALATGESAFGHELRIPDGDRTRWISVNASPILDADGDPETIVAAVSDITHLKTQARRLQRQRDDVVAELEEVYDRIDDAFVAFDENLDYVHVNERAESLLGLEAADLLGSKIWEVFDYDAQVDATLQEALQTQETISFVNHYGPLEAWFEHRVYPSESGLSLYFTDVTERKARERELEEYERIVETVSDGIYVLDGDRQFQLVNDAFVSMTRFDRSELVGSHASVVFGPNFDAQDAAASEQFDVDGTDVAVFEEEIYPAEGDPLVVESRFTQFEVDGEQGRAGVVRDITERKERQRELELYATIVETIPDGVYALDQDEEFVLVNEGFCELVGYERDELLGQHPTMVNSEAVNEQANELEAEMEAGGRNDATIEFELATSDGELVPVEGHFRHYSHGGVSGRCGVARDMTERVERERELERQREQLTALNNLNEVVREITDAVIEQSTREEIEETVCSHLAESESYLFAWIGDADPTTQTVTLRTEAGVEGYLDDIVISTDPDDERSEGATGRAFRTGEVQTLQHIDTDERYDPWRGSLGGHGFRSSASIPIVHGGTLYGTLNVYAERPEAFEGEEREMIGQLGEVVGHAIAAVERKQALLSDEVVELGFQIEHFVELFGIEKSCGSIELGHTVMVGDGEFLLFGHTSPDGADTLEALVETAAMYEEVTFRDERSAFELRVSEPPILSAVASMGGAIESAVITDGDYRLTVQLSPSADVGRLIDTVMQSYPDAALLKRRQLSVPDRGESTPESFTADLTDRQRTALETAHYAGFFEWPRGASGEDVADSLGVAPPTFHQHLRKAERKVFERLFAAA